MKISKIAKLCKATKRLCTFKAESGTWVGDACSMYFLPDVRDIDTLTLGELMGVSADGEKIMAYRSTDLNEHYDLEDVVEADAETPCTPMDIGLWISGQKIKPYITNAGVQFLNADRLAPLKEELENGGVYLRYEKKSGQPYFALKCGLLLCGIVIPSGVLTDQNMEQMEVLYKLSKVQHKILKEQREKEEAEQLRMEGKG